MLCQHNTTQHKRFRVYRFNKFVLGFLFITSFFLKTVYGQIPSISKINNSTNAYLMLINNNGVGTINSYILNNNEEVKNINVSSFLPGSYNVILVCNGQITDNKIITIN
jgi:phosphotransferase system  glucose/maltose/N-acetylglucosamine-specific IIC component